MKLAQLVSVKSRVLSLCVTSSLLLSLVAPSLSHAQGRVSTTQKVSDASQAVRIEETRLGTQRVLVAETGRSTGYASLVSIQAYLTNNDYRTHDALFNKLNAYMKLAKARGFFKDQALVVFPEFIGLYFYFMGEQDDIYTAPTLYKAGETMVLRKLKNIKTTLPFLFQPPPYVKGRPFDLGALFNQKLLNYKAPQVAQDYQYVFSKLAKSYGVYIAAGSVPLPGANVDRSGALRVNKRQGMYNTGVLFYPTGKVDTRLVLKAHPIKSEGGLGVVAGKAQNLPVYKLPFGRVAYAICADTWYPDVFERFNAENADIIVAPAMLGPQSLGDDPWLGYNFLYPTQIPKDVEELDIGWITEWEAWQKYSLLGRIDDTKATYGTSSFMKGVLWGEDFYGGPFVATPEVKTAIGNESGAGLISLIHMKAK